MRILLDAREAQSNTGTGNVIRNLYPKVIKYDKSNKYTILYTGDDPFPKVKCEKIKSPKERGEKFTYIWQIFGLSHLLNKNHFDRFFSVENIVYPLFFKGKTIISIQDVIPIALNNYYDKLYDKIKYRVKVLTLKIFPKKYIVYTISEFSKKEIVKYLKIDPGKIFVVKHGIDKKRAPFNSKHYLNKLKINFPYIMAIGGGEKRKNNKILEDIMRETKIEIKCILVGDINREKHASQFLEINENEKFIPVGMVDIKTLFSLYKNAKIFLFLSYYEGFGLPPLEAMSLGTPVIASYKSSIREILKDAAIYVNPFDKKEIEDSIILLLNNESLRKSMISKGKNLLKEYTWDKSAKNFIKIINNENR
jgi:glycosyltransferase involved in cell wall biosynthesis